jgi:long-chain fatty acid transport protein
MSVRRFLFLLGISGAVLLASVLTGSDPHAAGFTVNERSASNLGNAMAGSGAAGYDASTIYFNPAAMQLLERNQLSVAGHMIRPRGTFHDQASNTSGPASADSGETTIIPNLYYVHVPAENVRLGIGVYSPFGLRTAYPANWKGRYHAINSDLTTINIAPAVSYQMTSRLAAGASLDVQYLDSTLENAVDFGLLCAAQPGPLPCAGLGLLPHQADGRISIDNTDWAVGFSLGLLYTPADGTRFGITYHSPIRHGLNGQASFSGVPVIFRNTFTASPTRSDLTLPEELAIGIYHQLTPAWSVMADFGYMRWSRFDVSRLSFANGLPDRVAVNNWKNSRRYAAGINYRPAADWLLRTGVSYEETPVPDAAHRSPRPPDSDRIWLAFGFNYLLSEHISIDAAYAHVFVKDAPISNPDDEGHLLDGHFTGRSDILSFQLNWLF